MAFSPRTGLVYIPITQAGTRFSKAKARPGDIALGGVSMGLVKSDAMDGKGILVAWDPVHQKEAWRVSRAAYWNGGTMATAGGLVFQGTADGYLTAHNAATGNRVWQFYAGLGIMATPITYAIGGEQYVSVLVGYGGAAAGGGSIMRVGWKYTTPRRLLTFALDAHAPSPPTAPPDMRIHPVDDPNLKINLEDVSAGEGLYHGCMLCHGVDLVSPGGPGPDLRESQIALNPDALWKVVHDGALLRNGMPQFENLTREQVIQLYAYIRAGARKALSTQTE
jgi:quinohemoprotein ethanol dehydrogenase